MRGALGIVAAALFASTLGGLVCLWHARHRAQTPSRDGAAPAAAQHGEQPADLAADCRQMADWLRRLLGDECRVIGRQPWVIAGDVAEAELERRYRQQIAPAARALAADYFTTPPNEPISVLLFADSQRYRQQARRLLGRGKVSPHGHYRPHLRLVIVDASSGAGPLRHELTHALMDFDFPDAPQWLSEGLAAVCESCRIEDSPPRLAGIPGRRLATLQAAIRQGRLPSLKSLLSDAGFRNGPAAVHYAAARYLCLDLQRRGLLRQFYRELREGRAEDPTGEATLRRLLGEQQWSRLDEDFRRWVMKLKP